jgi:DNA polymerase-3 subunit alpha
MSKKKTEAMQAEREDFLSGAAAHGIDRALADEVFSEMLGFAKYAFNKSHATAYAMISYRTAYLKAHYPKEYFSALLTSVLSNNTAVKEYISDAQKMGVSVLPPDINSSLATFSVDGKNIRFGLLAIRNVGRLFADAVIRERRKSPFKSFDDFVSRMIDTDINKRTLESMIKCGVFDSLGVTRSALLMCYESILDTEHSKTRNNISGQLDLFSSSMGGGASVGYSYPRVNEFSLKELLLLEKESSGMYFSGHMIDNYESALSNIKHDGISDILSAFTDESESASRYKDGDKVLICGIVNSLKKRAVKSGDTMATLLIEDRFAEIEVIAFPKPYKQFESVIGEERCLLIEGVISLEENEVPRIFLRSAKEISATREPVLKKAEQEKNGEKKIFIRIPRFPDAELEKYLARMSALYAGSCQIILYDTASGKYFQNKEYRVNPSDALIQKFESRFSKNNIIVK